MSDKTFDVKQRSEDKTLKVSSLISDGDEWVAVAKTRRVMKEVTELVDETLSTKLEKKRVVDAKIKAGVEVPEETIKSVQLDEEESEKLLDITYKQIELLLVAADGSGGHPEAEKLMDTLDFEIATDLVKALMPSGEDQDSPPDTSQAGTS